jgi:exonuclease III
MVNFFNGEETSISTINCNSLNMSSAAKWNQTLKICGITKLKSDVIFLSDIRLSNKNLISASADIKNLFVNNPYEKYEFFFNSSKNKRGVGILVKKNIQFDILGRRDSEDENILLLRLRIRNSEVIFISVYGPNSVDNQFFNTVTEYLTENRNVPVILGGDWNATFSPDPIQNNLDCINMARLPNVNHSNKIGELCQNYDLSDPFRMLYPDRQEFTYQPRYALSQNKSRLDFFLVSDTLLDCISDCQIHPALQNKLFDHKAVTVIFNKRKKMQNHRYAISQSEINDDLLVFLVHATTAETYLIHWTGDQVDERYNKNFLLNACGTIKTLIRDAGPPWELRTGTEFDVIDIEARDRKINRIMVLCQLLNINTLENGPFTCNAQTIMETLLLNLKNEVTSHQKFMHTVKKTKKNWLVKTIAELKMQYDEHHLEIRDLENKLNALVDSEIRSELERFQQFDILNTEKMTPRFLSICKARNNVCSLDSICDDQGLPFRDEGSRDRYICNFYQQIYTPHIGNVPLEENCIENFLGPEICNNDLVKNSKLSADETAFFDRQLSLNELDLALSKINDKSAGGLDGIPTKFIKKFWSFLRHPLLNYANFSINHGSLTQSFNSAGIRLIPKKGDVTKIKNWRPISLLNVIFKIISKAVDLRLQRITDIVLSRGQKGFTKQRQLHECIINITETIAFAEKEKIPAFVLALDMAKAFDTVRHDYMIHVYRFFGFGENLIKMLNIISTGRTAHIIKDDGSTSPAIHLGTGFPQGNAPSPNQFNIGEQILIFKFELDPRIRAIKKSNIERLPLLGDGGTVTRDNLPDPEPFGVQFLENRIINNRKFGERELNFVTEKVEAFADDNNILALLEQAAMVAIKTVLIEFAVLSGLRCNVEKSQVLLIGTDSIPEYVIDSGFAVATELKILGFKVTKNHADMAKNFDPAIDKIRNTANFWNRFRLSLPGRINVAKTLMLSQIGFHATIVPVPDDKINEAQRIMEDFVSGTFKFDKKLICAIPEQGGLGLINVKHYILSLQCSWVKKAAAAPTDNWSRDLHLISGGKKVMLAPETVPDPVLHPVLETLNSSFWKLKTAFYTLGKNFFASRIGANPRLIKNKRDREIIALADLLPDLDANSLNNISNSLISDLTRDGIVFSDRLDFCREFAVNITGENFQTLCKTVKDSWLVAKKYSKNEISLSLEKFITRFRRGSKPFRKIFSEFEYANLDIRKNRRTVTFFKLINLTVPTEDSLKILNSQWNTTSYPVKLRDFCFKFRNNILGLNTRVSHFNLNRGRGCTFCTIKGILPVPDEDFLHIFFSCPETKKVHDNFFNRYLSIVNNDDIKKILFTGMLPEANAPNLFILAATNVILAYIWECKLQKRLPTLESMLNDLFYTTNSIIKSSSKIRDEMINNLPLCRDWHVEAGQRRA